MGITKLNGLDYEQFICSRMENFTCMKRRVNTANPSGCTV